ncbi:MAG: OstA-like protein [Weeksellaceae bacterium]|nr:OstA-like protein [Weeksellaceae bacterium]
MAQQPNRVKHLHSDKMQSAPWLYEGNLVYSGRVAFEHNGAQMFADTVILYQLENRFHARGNVRMVKDRNVLTARRLEYDGNSKIANAFGNVVMRDPQQTLYTEKLTYDRNQNIAYYDTGGTIVSKDNTINSVVGIYNLTTGENTFDSNVQISNPDYTITSKNVKHSSSGDVMEFFDNTFIQSKRNPRQFITTTRGRYYLNRKVAYLEERSTVHSDGKKLTADNIFYEQESGYGRATGDVVLEDPEERRYLTGNFGEAFEKLDSAYVTGNAVAVKAFERDSLYIHADTLMASKRDEQSLIRAFHGARFFKSNLQGKADSIAFQETTGLMNFYKDPIVWSGYRQITGDTITVFTNPERERLDSIHVRQNAFAISRKDSITQTEFHQLKSRIMMGLFVNEDLDWVQAEGNAQSLFYMEERDEEQGTAELMGINRSDCGIIEADLEERDIHVISCRIDADSKFYPPSRFPDDERYLPDFAWYEDMRPKRWQDILIVETPDNSLP